MKRLRRNQAPKFFLSRRLASEAGRIRRNSILIHHLAVLSLLKVALSN